MLTTQINYHVSQHQVYTNTYEWKCAYTVAYRRELDVVGTRNTSEDADSIKKETKEGEWNVGRDVTRKQATGPSQSCDGRVRGRNGPGERG